MTTLLINKPCPYCGTISKVAVPESGLRQWKSGTRIQDALPMLTEDEREILMSGVCPKCWDEVFGEVDE